MKVLVVEDEWLVRELIVGELLDGGIRRRRGGEWGSGPRPVSRAQSGRALHRHPIARANRRLGCSRTLSRIELGSPGGLRNRLLSDRASPRSRSRLNQQAVHLRPRHRCDQARHEPVFGRAAVRAARCHEPRSAWRGAPGKHQLGSIAITPFLLLKVNPWPTTRVHIASVSGNFSG